MKLIRKVLLLVMCLGVTLTGCNLWMDGSYSSTKPNYASGENHIDGVVAVSSYYQICSVLSEMIQEGMQEATLQFVGIPDSQTDYYIEMAIDYVLRTNPIGAYAVNKITYDVGTKLGKPAVAVAITYNRNRSEILQIKKAQNMEEAMSLIRIALDNCQPGVVARVNNYTNYDLTQYVQDYAKDNPQKCMEMPQVSVAYFPESGQERVIEISFTYQTNRETLRVMQQSVGEVFKSAQLYTDPGAELSKKYGQLYTFLMERYDYKIETSITPAYSLLRHGVGDSKAFAMVYAAMCRQVDLECHVVSGTKDGEAWHWNVVKQGDAYYHLDLLQCSVDGKLTFKNKNQMTGYVWDFSTF